MLLDYELFARPAALPRRGVFVVVGDGLFIKNKPFYQQTTLLSNKNREVNTFLKNVRKEITR